MPNFIPKTGSVIVPIATFEELERLWQKMAQTPEDLLVTEDVLPTSDRHHPQREEKFTLVVSEEFTALLSGRAIEGVSEDISIANRNLCQNTKNDNGAGILADLVPIARHQHNQKKSNLATPTTERKNGHRDRKDNLKMAVNVSFDPEAIASFLLNLVNELDRNIENKILNLQEKVNKITSNNLKLQSEFSMELIALLAGKTELNSGGNDNSSILKPNGALIESNFEENKQSDRSITDQQILKENKNALDSQSLEEAWQQQIEREEILDTVTSQLQKNFELPVIVSTAIEEGRKLLEVDRLVICKLLHPSNAPKSNATNFPKISVIYEALASETVKSVLGLNDRNESFVKIQKYRDKYRKGFIKATEDIEETYSLTPCLLKVMQEHNIRAQLIVPIIANDDLWGLLIAQDSCKRKWEDGEQKFIQQMAEHLAIAIYQTQIYAELQQQKQTLEKQVIERTQHLYDALQAAEFANRSKSEFLAAIGHELRTPLTSVIGISSTLLNYSFGNKEGKQISTDKQRDYLKTIYESGKKLQSLINDFLDMSQIEAGKNLLTISSFSLSKLAESSLNSLKEEAEEKAVNLIEENHLSAEQDQWMADEKRLQQILLHLLKNAIKFTPAGGTVTLRFWLEKNTVIFEIEDTGIGISEKERSLLFKTFKQLDASYDRLYGGTGLGLALTKQLVEMHGGIIEVESTVNVGSLFRVRIPSINN